MINRKDIHKERADVILDTSLFVKRLDLGSVTDVAEDFSLPDYQPEIRRVVGVCASVVIDGKYLSGEELEADGCVTYTVLYVTVDGSLAQTSQTTSYTASLPVKCEDDRFSVGDMVLAASVDGVNCRVTGPRRFTLTSRVRHTLMSQKKAEAGLKVEKPDKTAQLPPVRMKSKKHTTAAICETRKSCEISGLMREREGLRVVMAQGSVALSDVRIGRPAKKEATVKGEAFVTLLLVSPEGEYIISRGRGPVEEIVELGDMADASDVYGAAFGNVASMEIESADNGDIRWHMEYDIDCDVLKCCECETAEDAYLPATEDRLTAEHFSAYAPACAVNGRLTVTTSAKLREGMKYICAWGSGTAEKCEISSGRMTVSGSLRITLVSGGEGETVSEELVLPVKYECEAIEGVRDLTDGETTRRVQINVTDVDARADGDKVSIAAELAISVIALGEEQITAVVGITPVGEQTEWEERTKQSAIRVYVPDENEDAWDVEKRFRLGKEPSAEGEVYII